ncbi:TPA: hypothetical protein N0F65_012372 [Lagenidium giganteum]|uniref:Uncharacterized protein n=1 Tax=Lagenidium giganteum TaxID=4803 RepID=A0AAV2YNH0_9STRA|nr:TPA: hypothetical protein N0F65_012372 [Lagenidium giganteum]
MPALWSSASKADWDSAWDAYESTVKASDRDGLVALDNWFRTSLPTLLHERDPDAYIKKEELVKLMEWKLKKGKWRPQLMKFVTSLEAKEVENASRTALKEIQGGGDLKTAVTALCELKGIGPATASAVLAAYDNDVPFMADEALEALASIIGPRKYTLPHYLAFADQLRAKAQWLRKQSKADKGEEWTAQRVQLALYASAHCAVAKAIAPKAAKVKAEKVSTKRKQGPEADAEKADKPLAATVDTETTGLRRSKRTRAQ